MLFKKKHIFSLFVIISIILYNENIKTKEKTIKKSIEKKDSFNKKQEIFLSIYLNKLKKIKEKIKNVSNKYINLDKTEVISNGERKLIAKYLEHPERLNYDIDHIEKQIEVQKNK